LISYWPPDKEVAADAVEEKEIFPTYRNSEITERMTIEFCDIKRVPNIEQLHDMSIQVKFKLLFL
jgi:hypothetical protein